MLHGTLRLADAFFCLRCFFLLRFTRAMTVGYSALQSGASSHLRSRAMEMYGVESHLLSPSSLFWLWRPHLAGLHITSTSFTIHSISCVGLTPRQLSRRRRCHRMGNIIADGTIRYGRWSFIPV